MSPNRDRFNTAPARLKREAPISVWDLFDDPAGSPTRAPAPIAEVPSSSAAGALAGGQAPAALAGPQPPFDRDASGGSMSSIEFPAAPDVGGSWPRVRKQLGGGPPLSLPPDLTLPIAPAALSSVFGVLEGPEPTGSPGPPGSVTDGSSVTASHHSSQQDSPKGADGSPKPTPTAPIATAFGGALSPDELAWQLESALGVPLDGVTPLAHSALSQVDFPHSVPMGPPGVLPFQKPAPIHGPAASLAPLGIAGAMAAAGIFGGETFDEASFAGTYTAPPQPKKERGERNHAARTEWSQEEDELIMASVTEHGCKWRKISAMLPGRSDDAVRNRWNRLNDLAAVAAAEAAADGAGPSSVPPCFSPHFPSKSHAKKTPSAGAKPKSSEPRVSWSKAEDELIMQSVSEWGHKWNKVAQLLPGRTDHAIRNRYHRLLTLLQDRASLSVAAAPTAAPAAAPAAPPVAAPPAAPTAEPMAADGFLAAL